MERARIFDERRKKRGRQWVRSDEEEEGRDIMGKKKGDIMRKKKGA